MLCVKELVWANACNNDYYLLSSPELGAVAGPPVAPVGAGAAACPLGWPTSVLGSSIPRMPSTIVVEVTSATACSNVDNPSIAGPLPVNKY